MCGIFGVINFDGSPLDKQRVLSARDILAHRGPDDEGIYFSTSHSEQSEESPSVALSHRRLSIIDLSPSGHQPMVSDNGRYVIVFNGEIYNFEEIKSQVSNRQSAVGKNQFRTNSDTEVILKLFELEGPECLKRLRGMFAFAIWDDKEKKLFAARDRFGIKPFYYLHNNNGFIFSSELKAIKKYKNGLTLSMEGMDAFLKTGSVPAPLTIYEETKALLPGHWLEIDCHPELKRRISIQSYWSFFDLIDDGHTSTQFTLSKAEGLSMTAAESLRARQGGRSNLHYDDEAKGIIRNSLLDAVKAHMVSDVEVGAFLSGGIDSTAIVSLMRQAGHEKIKTISVTFPGFVHDEAEYSNIAAQKFGTDHYEYRLQEHEIIDDLDRIISIMDQPTIDGINTYFVSKAAKAFGLKVVLSGLGGDELFGGYPSFYKIPKYHRIANLPFAKLAMKAAIPFVKNKLPGKAIRFMKEPNRQNAEYILMRGLFTDDELNELGWKHSYKHPFAIDTMDKNNDRGYDYNYPVFNLKDSPLQYVCELETNHYMRNQLLRDADVFSMANSIELRVPFVDHLLYKDVLPYLHSSFDKNETKKMLVSAVEDLPKVISERMKMGFTFPFDVWMRSGKIKDAINDSLVCSSTLFGKSELNTIMNKFNSGKLHWSRIWALYIANEFNN